MILPEPRRTPKRCGMHCCTNILSHVSMQRRLKVLKCYRINYVLRRNSEEKNNNGCACAIACVASFPDRRPREKWGERERGLSPNFSRGLRSGTLATQATCATKETSITGSYTEDVFGQPKCSILSPRIYVRLVPPSLILFITF